MSGIEIQKMLEKSQRLSVEEFVIAFLIGGIVGGLFVASLTIHCF